VIAAGDVEPHLAAAGEALERALAGSGAWAIVTHGGRRYLVELAAGAAYTFTSEFSAYGDPARPPERTDLKLSGRVERTWQLPKGNR
jgi:hypothetical protein